MVTSLELLSVETCHPVSYITDLFLTSLKRIQDRHQKSTLKGTLGNGYTSYDADGFLFAEVKRATMRIEDLEEVRNFFSLTKN